MKRIVFSVCVGIAVLAAVPALGLTEVARQVTESMDPVTRTRTAGRTWLFSERQPYLPMYNYIPQKYIDRPLFTDVTLRDRPNSEIAAYFREIEIARWSGFDGFGSIAYPNVFYRQIAELSKSPVAGYTQFPILHGFPRKPAKDNPSYRTMKEMIVAAAKSPVTLKFDGKPLVWWWGSYLENTYGTYMFMKDDPEIPPIVFLPSPPQRGQDESDADYAERLRQRLRETDGFKLELVSRGPVHWRGERGITVFHNKTLLERTLPLVVKVMEEPEFRGRKFLGANLEQAYINQLNGNVTSQNGTEMLRVFLDEAIRCSPDFLVGFEWNEGNENTAFQPTVSSAGAVARVCNYYLSLMNTGRPTPRPGDDVSVPNLIVSTRRSLRVGEKYHVELLSVPDGTAPAPYRARITVRDDKGAVRAEGPWENLPTAKLTAFDYRMNSRDFTGASAVYPVIEVEKNGAITTYEGFDSAKLNPTWCVDFLYVRQPLREMILRPRAEFTVTPSGEGYAFKARFACGEELSSLEVMEGNEEKLAADRSKRFDRAKYDYFVGGFSCARTVRFDTCTLDVEGSKEWQLIETGMPWPAFSVVDKSASGGPRKVKFNLGGWLVPFFFAVPKGEIGNARFVVNLAPLGEPRAVSVRELREKGRDMLAWRENDVVLELERLDMLPDYAPPIGATSAEIEETLPAKHSHPVFHLRAITKSGKVWRSKPVAPVEGLEVPNLAYDFGTTEYGEWVPTAKGDRRWWAKLGCGWGGGEPMWWEAAGWKKDRLPANYRNSFPERVVDEGRAALRFDGSGQYVTFPKETIPCDSEYAVRFEMKPDTADNQVLLRMLAQTETETTLRLLVKDGELYLSHFGFCLVPQHFMTGLKVRPGVWQTVKVVRRADGFDVALDEQKKHIPYGRWGLIGQSVIFGSNIQPGRETPQGLKAYSGLLRSFRVQHR